jgi:hypothetical protein
VANVEEKLAVGKQRWHRFHMEKMNLKKLNVVTGNEKYHVGVSIGLELWKIWMLRWILIVLGKLSERILNFQPNTLWVIMN